MRRLWFTVDLEPDCPPYLQEGYRGITDGLPRLLELLERESVPGTFFTTGEVAWRHPDSVAGVLSEGHALGCHGWSHRPFPEMALGEAEEEIHRSAGLLREFGPVYAFRAPYLRLPSAHLPLLVRAGFTVDSSSARYKAGGGSPGPPGLRRIPASVTSSVLRLPAAVRNPWLLSLRSPVTLFVHPWEFVDLTGERLRLDCRFRTGEPALQALREVFRLFRRRGGRFLTLEEVAGG